MLSLARSSNLPSAGGPETVLLQCKHWPSCLVLLPIGFVLPQSLSACAVSSYLAVSPLPRQAGRFIFCDTFHRVTPPGRYPVLCLIRSPDFPPWITPQRLPNHLTKDIVSQTQRKVKLYLSSALWYYFTTQKSA